LYLSLGLEVVTEDCRSRLNVLWKRSHQEIHPFPEQGYKEKWKLFNSSERLWR